MKKILVVDDIRQFPPPVTYARTSARAVQLLRKTPQLDELWLDHDLGGRDTAMPVVDWLSERAFNDNPFPVKKIFVHTSNPSGAATMVRTLTRWGYDTKPTAPPHAEYCAFMTTTHRVATALNRNFWQLAGRISYFQKVDSR